MNLLEALNGKLPYLKFTNNSFSCETFRGIFIPALTWAETVDLDRNLFKKKKVLAGTKVLKTGIKQTNEPPKTNENLK